MMMMIVYSAGRDKWKVQSYTLFWNYLQVHIKGFTKLWPIM